MRRGTIMHLSGQPYTRRRMCANVACVVTVRTHVTDGPVVPKGASKESSKVLSFASRDFKQLLSWRPLTRTFLSRFSNSDPAGDCGRSHGGHALKKALSLHPLQSPTDGHSRAGSLWFLLLVLWRLFLQLQKRLPCPPPPRLGAVEQPSFTV